MTTITTNPLAKKMECCQLPVTWVVTCHYQHHCERKMDIKKSPQFLHSPCLTLITVFILIVTHWAWAWHEDGAWMMSSKSDHKHVHFLWKIINFTYFWVTGTGFVQGQANKIPWLFTDLKLFSMTILVDVLVSYIAASLFTGRWTLPNQQLADILTLITAK